MVRPGAKLSQFLEAAFTQLKERVIGSMVAYVNTRFANVNTDDVIAAFDMFNTSLWNDSDDELTLHGEQELLNTLVDHFKPLLERNGFDSELV